MRGLVVFVLLLPSMAIASDRVKLSDNSATTSIKDTLEAVSRAVDSEDLDMFENCFADDRREHIRRRYAMVFVQDNCSMEIMESQTIKMGKDSAEAAVRYRLGGVSGSQELVSIVKFVKEGDRWLIDRETIVDKKPCGNPGSQNPGRTNHRVNVGREPEWDPMNPDPTRISPHLKHLIGDIGISPGMGCSGGNCPGGRCNVR